MDILYGNKLNRSLVKYTDFLISFFFDGRNQTPLIQMFVARKYNRTKLLHFCLIVVYLYIIAL